MRIVTTRIHCLLSILAVVCLYPSSVHPSDVNMMIDYEPILKRCCGVVDEPSIFKKCGREYSAIRVTEGEGGYPVGLVRIEKQLNDARFTARLFKDRESPVLTELTISASEWARIWTLLRASDFWTFEYKDSVWKPHGPSIWIEACEAGQFRSISVNPEFDDRMTEVVDFLAGLWNQYLQ